MKAHRDVVRRSFRAGPDELLALADEYLNTAAYGSFQSRQADFAVALQSVSVSHGEECSGNVYRKIQCRTRDQLLVVEIPRVKPRRAARDSAHHRRRRYPDRTEKRRERQNDAGFKFRCAGGRVDTHQLELRVWKIIR